MTATELLDSDLSPTDMRKALQLDAWQYANKWRAMADNPDLSQTCQRLLRDAASELDSLADSLEKP